MALISITPIGPLAALTSISVFDLVGPNAANRQPNTLKSYDDLLQTTVDALVANSNEIVTGGAGSTLLFLPRDGSLAMTAALDFGGFKGVDLGTPTADTDAATKKYADDIAHGNNVLSGTNITPDWDNGPMWFLTLTGNTVINAPTNMPIGSQAILMIKQVGSLYTVGLQPAYVTNFGVYSVSTTVDLVDVLTIINLDDTHFLTAVVQGFLAP